jgi:hypothetical protein
MQKIAMYLIFASLWISFQGISQPPQGQGQPMPIPDRVNRTIDRLKPELKLTDVQVKDLNPIYTEFYTKLDSIRAGGQRPTPEDRAKIMDPRDAKLKKVLDEAQFKRLKELEAEMRQNRPNGR